MIMIMNGKSEVPFLKTCLMQLLLVATDSPRLDDVEAGVLVHDPEKIIQP